MTDRIPNGSHRKQREAHMRQEPPTSVMPTGEQRRRARVTVARLVLADPSSTRREQVADTRLLLDMLGLREAP